MAAGRVLATQFQRFIKSRFSLDDDDGLMACKYFLAYTQIEDTSSRSGNDTHANDADIIPIYDEEPMAEVEQDVKHIEQPEMSFAC
ncbi:hypothetical protein Tco_0789551 [Tanacetum coccineum]